MGIFFFFAFQIAVLYMLSRLYINVSQVYFPFYITLGQNYAKVSIFLDVAIILNSGDCLGANLIIIEFCCFAFTVLIARRDPGLTILKQLENVGG